MPGSAFPLVKPPRRARVGLYSIGHPQYWVQFPGLLDRLVEYGRFIERRLSAWAEVCNAGMVDDEGKARAGVSVEAKVKTGPVTTLGVTQTRDGRLKIIVNEGAATDGPTLLIGNPMTQVDFGRPIRKLMDAWFAHGPTHHFAMSVGHNASRFEKVARLLGWPFEREA